MENTYHCYANRELSWLRFNERVLEEAEDSRLPLCERLSFLSIFQSNLDEFFMVRIGSLQDQMLLDKNARENKTNMTSGEQIDAALAFIHKLTARRDAAYNGLLEQLAEQGIRLLDFAHMEEESRTELEKLFRQDYLPLLSSFIISKKQAFPFLKNKGIYAVAVLSTKAEKKKIGIVPCGNEIFPRLVPVPGRTGCFILSEELILHFLPLLYKGYKVTSKTLARITRNADIDADLIYDEDLNYRDHMAEVVKKRKKLAPVRLELSREIDEEIIQSLCKNLKLDPKRVFEYDSPLDHSFLFQIEDQLRSHTDLFFAPRHPQPSPALDERKPIIPQILEEDKLIHYPYESIRPFLQLLHEAACDPDVVSIKMTLYRLANHSKVVDALVEAAENGKQVDVLVELKARFDEENNIEWSRLLERAGCHVVYGIEGLKVHSNDNISVLYVVDENEHFYGAIDLKDLIIARAEDPLAELIVGSYPYVTDREKISDCIERIVDYAERSLPVLNEAGKLMGIITSSDVVELVDDEMSDDYAKLGGLTGEEDLRESVFESVKKRLPWLTALLFLGMLVSSVVGAFESVVAVLPVVICFQSMVLGMAGNVGTQSLAVTIRVLVDENLTVSKKFQLLWKEVRVGLLNGTILAVMALSFLGCYIHFFKGYAWNTALLLSGCVGASLVVAMVVSSLVGTLVPMLFHKIHIDPAVASGPLITTINDLVAVVVYYGLAMVVLIDLFHLA